MLYPAYSACIQHVFMWCGLMSTAGNTFKDKGLSFAAPFFQCLPQPRQSEEVLPHQPEVVLSVLHVQSGGIFRSAMTCGRSLCRLERHRTFHRTLFLPPLADACQSVRGLIKFQVQSNFALFDVRIACHESPFLLKRDRGKTLGACVISHSLSTSEC